MAKADDILTPEGETSGSGDLFGRAEVVTKAQHDKAKPGAREPQMRALRRILGDVVFNIFPEALMASVEKAYVHWQEHPDSFLVTPFDTPQDAADSLLVMRAYCECTGTKGYTIRTQVPEDPKDLIWRVQTRRGSKGRD